MNTKTLLQFVHSLSRDACREVGEILIEIADAGPRTADEEARLQAYINSFPDGRCCECSGTTPQTQTEEQST